MSEDQAADTRVQKIRMLNDEFRRTFQGGRVLFTPGVLDLDPRFHNRLLREIMNFSDFEPENDPYQEHDFGAVHFTAEKIFWKIDYYDSLCNEGSPDPADPNVTTRVMTIMLASEY